MLRFEIKHVGAVDIEKWGACFWRKTHISYNKTVVTINHYVMGNKVFFEGFYNYYREVYRIDDITKDKYVYFRELDEFHDFLIKEIGETIIRGEKVDFESLI